MTHPDEETLELFVLESAEVADQRAAIQAHLAECAGCMSLFEDIEAYYSDVCAVHEERSKAVSQALTVRTLAVTVPTYTEFGPLSQIPKSLPARMVLFVIRHPYISAASFAGFFVGALMAAQMLLVPALKDRNPSYARARDEFLIVYNKEGDVLWKKHAGVGYDMDRLAKDNGLQPDRYLSVVDVDGDGKNEVIATFLSSDSLSREIICYRTDGSERWRFQFRRRMVFGTEEFSGQYRFLMFMTGDFDGKGAAELIAVATFPDYYPTAILKVDGSTGRLLGEYWSSGNVSQMIQGDLDGDGNEELYLGGANNGSDRAFLIVLNPRILTGHTPAPLPYTPQGIPEGAEKYYLEFPRSDLRQVASQKRNLVRGLQFLTDSSLSVAVGELIGSQYYLEFYHLDRTLTCTKADWQDETISLYKRLIAEGKLKRRPDATYYERLRKSVEYWDGEKFVATPTMNKKYLDVIRQLAKK